MTHLTKDNPMPRPDFGDLPPEVVSDKRACAEEEARRDLTKSYEQLFADAYESPIEQLLLKAILDAGLPRPVCQREFRDSVGNLITIADFAYEDQKIAIHCDGYALHGTADKLAGDAMNGIQSRDKAGGC